MVMDVSIRSLTLKDGSDVEVRSEGGSSQGLLFVHHLTFYRCYSIVWRTKVLRFCTLS